MDQPQQTELLGLCLQELTVVTEKLGEPPYRARQLFDGLYRQRWSGWEQFTTLPMGVRRRLGELGFAVGGPRVEKKFVSSDGTVRYLLGFADGQSVETVWMPEGDGGGPAMARQAAMKSWRARRDGIAPLSASPARWAAPSIALSV